MGVRGHGAAIASPRLSRCAADDGRGNGAQRRRQLLQGIKRVGARRTAVGLASAVVVISLLNLAAYAWLDLGLDRWLFSDRLANQPGPYPLPGRMAEATALCFLLVAFATAAKALRRMALPAVAAATLALVLAGVALLACLFDAPILRVAGFSAVSLPTALVLAVLSAGVLAAEPLRGWPRRLTLDTPGGNLARVLLPLALILPIGIGAAALIATRAGYFPPDFRLVAVCAVTALLLGASVMRLHLDGFREDGGPAALVGSGRSYALATTTLGLRAATQLDTDLPITVRGMVGWRHAFGDVSPAALLAFSGGVSGFNVAGIPIDRDALVAEAGLDWQISPDMTLGVSYAGQVGQRAQDHAVKGSFTWRFGTR